MYSDDIDSKYNRYQTVDGYLRREKSKSNDLKIQFSKFYKKTLKDELIPATDCKLIVGDSDNLKEFELHKVVLSIKSPYFNNLFGEKYKQIKATVNEPDLSACGVENLLRFIYCDELSEQLTEKFDDSFALTYIAADKYLVDDLKERLLDLAYDRLSFDTAISIYNQLYKLRPILDEVPLKDIAYFICTYAELIITSESFLDIEKEALVGLLELDSIILKEIDLFKNIQRWVNNQLKDEKASVISIAGQDDRLTLLKSFKNLIKFKLLNENEFNEIPKALFTDDEYLEFKLFFANKSIENSSETGMRNRKAGKLVYDHQRKRFIMRKTVDEMDTGDFVYFKNGVYKDDLLDNRANNFEFTGRYLVNSNLDDETGALVYLNDGVYKDDLLDKSANDSKSTQECSAESSVDASGAVDKAIDFKDSNCIYIYKIRRTMGNEKFENKIKFSCDNRIIHEKNQFFKNGFFYFDPPLRFQLDVQITLKLCLRTPYYILGHWSFKLEKIHSNNKLDVVISSFSRQADSSSLIWDFFFHL